MKQSESTDTPAPPARYIVLRAFSSDVPHKQGDVVTPGPGWPNLSALVRTRYLVREDEHAALQRERAEHERHARAGRGGA